MVSSEPVCIREEKGTSVLSVETDASKCWGKGGQEICNVQTSEEDGKNSSGEATEAERSGLQWELEKNWRMCLTEFFYRTKSLL